MRLYSGPVSLFTAKVRIALDEKGLDYDRVEVGWTREAERSDCVLFTRSLVLSYHYSCRKRAWICGCRFDMERTFWAWNHEQN